MKGITTGRMITASLLLVMALVCAALFSQLLSPLAMPRSVLIAWTLCRLGYPGAVITGCALSAFLLITGCLFMRGGVWRWVSVWMLAGASGLIATVYAALLIFSLWTHIRPFAMPWQVFSEYAFIAHQPRLVTDFHLSFGIAFVTLALGVGGLLLMRFKSEKNVLGDAHFASPLEIKKSGMYEGRGLIVGQAWGELLRVDGFEHVLGFAPSGSGKTRSIAIPNLLSCDESMIVNDVKKTLYHITSGHRQREMGHTCYLWALSWSKGDTVITHRFNPFDLIPADKLTRMKELQRHAHIHIPNGKGDLIWYSGARKIFKMLSLYLLDSPDKKATLGELSRAAKRHNFDDWLAVILKNTEQYDPEFYRNGFSYLNNHEKTRAGILEQFSSYFELYDDPVIDAATSATDFDLRNLRREKMTIYVAFSDDDKERLSPLLTLFWQQVISSMIREVPKKAEEPHSVLLLMDEFSSLGRVNGLRESIKLLREYRVRLVILIQYIAQTMEKYTDKEAKAFLNTRTKIAFTPDDDDDAKYISELLDKKTVKISSGSSSHNAGGYGQSSNYQYQAIPLMRPAKIKQLSRDKVLVFKSEHAPVLAGQCIWYKHPALKAKQQSPTLVPVWPLKQVEFVRGAPPDNAGDDESTVTPSLPMSDTPLSSASDESTRRAQFHKSVENFSTEEIDLDLDGEANIDDEEKEVTDEL